MQILKLEVEESKMDIVLNIVKNLKDNIIKKYEVIDDEKGDKGFINISQVALNKVWDNKEDSVYDKYLKI